MSDPTGPANAPAHSTTATSVNQAAGRSSGAATGSNDTDWTDQVTGLIVESVDKVRDRTTGPILDYSQASVHAIVALILAVPLFVLGVILAVRVLTYFVFREVWITYAVLGTLFVLIGVVLWSRRKPIAR